MSHITLVGITEQQHSSCKHSLQSQYCNQSSPSNNSDQSPSHIGHCESSTTCLLTFLANFSDFLLSVLTFLAFGCFMAFASAFFNFFSLAKGFCWIFWFCWAMLSARDCLYAELWRTSNNLKLLRPL